MTVLEAIKRGADYLAGKQVESARLQSELLLAHVLKLKRMQLYLNFERALTEAEVNTLRDLIRRRGAREPLQHVLGTACFCGLELQVDSNVLVPRPETEILAELGWQYLLSISQESTDCLDYGTGSGCIAIAIASKCANARVLAVDNSPAALEVAKANASRCQVSAKIQFLLAGSLAELPPTSRFNLIVSNPPYIPSGELEHLEPEVRNFEPRQALDGGPDGLTHYRAIAATAGALLQPDGKLMLEFGDGQEQALAELFETQNWIVEKIHHDYTGRPRILVARRTGT